MLLAIGLFGAEVKSAISGGRDAGKDSWLFMVQLNLTGDGKDTWGCGATVLTEQYLLTAASCWDG